MLPTLAQLIEQDPQNIFEVMNAVMSRGDALTHGDQLTHALQSMSVVWAVVFLVAGLTCMFNGYKFYKVVTVILAMAIGGVAGYWMGEKIGAAYIVAACLSLLLAVCCFPLMKYAVAIMGGLAGAFIGANVWAAGANLIFSGARAEAFADNYWVGALVGLLTLGMLAFIVFKLSVVLFTSMSGSTLMVFGALALALQVPAWQESVVSSVSAHPIIVPMLVLVPTAIGLLIQETNPSITAAAKADSGKAQQAKPAAG